MTEVSLIKKAQEGDEEAFSMIYDKYQRMIFFKVKRFYLISIEKEDFVQEGRIGLFKAIKSYDEKKGASFSTFASLCVDRRLLTALNCSSAQKYKTLKMATVNYINNERNSVIENLAFSQHNNPESILIGKEKLDHLKNKLRVSLSKMEEEILRHMIFGLNYSEIAKKTGRSPKTVDNTMQRVKNKIKQHLEYY